MYIKFTLTKTCSSNKQDLSYRESTLKINGPVMRFWYFHTQIPRISAHDGVPSPCRRTSGLDVEGLFTGGHLKPQARSERRKP